MARRKISDDLMLGIAIMRVARFLNLPNRRVVLCEFIKAIATIESSSLRMQEPSSVQWTCTDIIAYACKEGIAFLNEELLDTFIKHCKSPLDAFSMLAYASDTHNILLRAEGLNSLLLKLIESHKRKNAEHADLVWTAITKLAACCEVRDDVLVRFLVDCSAEQRKELLKARSSSKHSSAHLFMEYFRNKASIDDLQECSDK